MARRRMIDPNFFCSEDVSRLEPLARLLLVGMISNADDAGRGRGNPAYLRSCAFPYDDIPTPRIEEMLDAIEAWISITFYAVNGQRYYQFKHWAKWQRVEKPQKSIIPAPEADSKNDSGNDSGNDSENGSGNDSGNDSGPKEKKRREEEKKEREEKSGFVPPSPEELAEYCLSRGNLVDPSRWMDYYQANGWMMGRSPMCDWKAAVRRWESNAPVGAGHAGPPGKQKNPASDYSNQRKYPPGFFDSFFDNEEDATCCPKK